MHWRVLVLDGSARQALAAVRALGRGSHEVGVAGHASIELAGLSRYATRYHVLPDPRRSGNAFSATLDALVADHGYDVVIASDEASLARFRVAPPPTRSYPTVDEAWLTITDKLALAGVAHTARVAYPETRAPGDGLPPGDRVVVKPARSAEPVGDGIVHHVGAAVVPRPEAEAAMAALARRGLRPIAQELVDRRDKVNLTVFRRDGVTEMRFVYRVLRDVPLSGGIAMATETLDAEGEVGREAVGALVAVMDSVGYEGVANGEFCVSPDGLVLIEVNPRLWGSTWFAERLGQRVVERGVRQALELEPLPEVPYRPGRRFHHLPGELRWVRLHPDRGRALREWAATTRPRDVFEYDELRDAGALLRYAWLRLRRR